MACSGSVRSATAAARSAAAVMPSVSSSRWQVWKSSQSVRTSRRPVARAGCLLEELTGARKGAMGPLEHPQREQDARSRVRAHVGVEHLGRQPSSAVCVTRDVRVLRRRGEPVTTQQRVGSEPGRAFHGASRQRRTHGGRGPHRRPPPARRPMLRPAPGVASARCQARAARSGDDRGKRARERRPALTPRHAPRWPTAASDAGTSGVHPARPGHRPTRSGNHGVEALGGQRREYRRRLLVAARRTQHGGPPRAGRQVSELAGVRLAQALGNRKGLRQWPRPGPFRPGPAPADIHAGQAGYPRSGTPALPRRRPRTLARAGLARLRVRGLRG